MPRTLIAGGALPMSSSALVASARGPAGASLHELLLRYPSSVPIVQLGHSQFPQPNSPMVQLGHSQFPQPNSPYVLAQLQAQEKLAAQKQLEARPLIIAAPPLEALPDQGLITRLPGHLRSTAIDDSVISVASFLANSAQGYRVGAPAAQQQVTLPSFYESSMLG